MSEELIGAAALTCRYVVGFVLLAAAIPKLGERREFVRAVRNYGLLPRAFVAPVAAWLPRLELLCALALLLGVAVGFVAGVAAVLLGAFTVAIAVNLVRGRRIDCGCSGAVAPRQIGWALVVGDVVLAGMAASAALADPGVLTLVGEPSSSLTTGDGVAIAMLASVLVLGQLVVSSWIRVRRQVTA